MFVALELFLARGCIGMNKISKDPAIAIAMRSCIYLGVRLGLKTNAEPVKIGFLKYMLFKFYVFEDIKFPNINNIRLA